jgi:hypothetical protein
MIEVEFRHVPRCPHANAARALLKECLTELKLDVAVDDKEGEYPSPSILVNGEDVMGASIPSCVLPTRCPDQAAPTRRAAQDLAFGVD